MNSTLGWRSFPRGRKIDFWYDGGSSQSVSEAGGRECNRFNHALNNNQASSAIHPSKPVAIDDASSGLLRCL